MDQPHNGKPCWCARAVQSTYIFHTKGNRWVVGKRLDDGSKCYAFLNDKAGKYADPADQQQKGGETWNCPDDEGEWHADSTVSCTKVPPANDKFVQLRMTLDNEMKQYGLVERSSLKKLWRRLDYNGNGVVSLAEIDKLVVENVAGGVWPAWLNNKPALMRAYKKTILKDGDGDDWVEKHEFHALLLNIFWFNKLWLIFQHMADDGTGADRRMDVNEFVRGMSQLGLNLNDAEARQEFAKIDSNHGGQVLFVEFCAYIRKRVNPDDDPNFDADIVSGEKCGKVMRKHGGHRATTSHFVNKKCYRDFDELEKIIKATIADKKKLLSLWKRLDFNGNNIVSLAEIDKLAVEKYPLLNHKPALMRAYKMTISKKGGGDGDDWVERKEFKRLLANLFYFNKIFWVFDQVDNDKDRRMNFQEFKHCLAVCGSPMSQSQARAEFQKVDRNGGGIILFNEFCLYFTETKCPHAMSDFVDEDPLM